MSERTWRAWTTVASAAVAVFCASLAFAIEPGSSMKTIPMAVAVGDSPILKCPLFDAIAWSKGTDGIIFVNERFVGEKPMKYKYGLTVIAPLPSPPQVTPTPKSGGQGAVQPQQNNQYHLHIRKAALADAGTYQCQNSDGKKVVTALNVVARPRCNPARLPSPLTEGDKLFFTCSVLAAGSKLPVVYWTKGSQADLGTLKMPERKPSRDPVLLPAAGVSTVANQLQFKVNYQDNGLNLSCSASHPDWSRPDVGSESADKLSCVVGTLNVNFKPKLICDEKQIFQPDSKEFYVYCDVLANPWDQVEQHSWRVFLNESSPGLKPEHHPNFTVKEYYLMRESGIRTRVHIISRDVAKDGLVFLLQVFSTAGNMEKRITLHIPKEFPVLWAGIGGSLGAILVCVLCFVHCVICRKNSDEFDGKSEKDFYPGTSEMDGGSNFFSSKTAPDRQSRRARGESQWDSDEPSRLGRDSKRKIVLTHPIEMEGETAITDASALHDTPPNVNQYQKQHHVKTKPPKEPRLDNHNKTPQRLEQQQQQQQQQSRALIHADDRKATTAHAGHTPRSDRRRKERKNKTDRSGSEDGRSIEAFEIEEHPDPEGSYGADHAQHQHSLQHNRFKGGDASERPIPPPRPRSTLDTSGLSSMHSPSSHSHDSLLKLNMDSVQEELKRKLTSPQRESLRSAEATTTPTTLIPPPLIVDAEISPTPHDIIAPTPIHHNHPLATSTGFAPEDKYRLVDKYFPPPKTTDILREDVPSKKAVPTSDVVTPPPPPPSFKPCPGEKPTPSPKPHFQDILAQQPPQHQQQPPSSAFTPVPNFHQQQQLGQGSSSPSASPSKHHRPRAFYATPKGPAPPIPHHKSAFHQPRTSSNEDQPEHPPPPPPSFSPQMSLSSGYASKAGSYQSEC